MAAPYTVSPMTESLTRKQLRAGRAYLSYSLRRSTIFTVERALLRVASGWSHCICHQEAESRLEVGPEVRVPRCYTFKSFQSASPARHQVFKHRRASEAFHIQKSALGQRHRPSVPCPDSPHTAGAHTVEQTHALMPVPAVLHGLF